MTTATPKKRHVFLWIFLAIQALFILWLIVGGHSAQSGDCTGLDAKDCQDAKDVGTAIGLGLIFTLWAITDIIVGGTYAIYRLATRK